MTSDSDGAPCVEPKFDKSLTDSVKLNAFAVPN